MMKRSENKEPTIIDNVVKDCSVCDGSGWDFKDRPPPFPKCPKCNLSTNKWWT